MEEVNNETLDLSRRGLKKLEKAPTEESKTIINLILDQNELQRLDNIDSYSRIENLSVCNNFLLRMHGVSRLTNIRVLALNNNGILQIEGLKDLIYLKVLKLAGNNIKSIEHLNHNMHLEHLDLSNNQICFIADISYLKSLKYLSLERNRLIDLRQCDRNLPPNLDHLGLAHNNIRDLNEVCHLAHLGRLDSVTLQGNPCVAMAGKDQLGFDYRPFVLNWILSVKSIDGFVVSAIESLKAEWLYSQGKGRHFQTGQHEELCEYLASTCPLTADALETEDQRKLRLILSKAQQHQQQLKDQNHSPNRSKLQSPRMQSRMTPRHVGRSPDRLSERLTSSYHAALSRSTNSPVTSLDEPRLMSRSIDSPALFADHTALNASEHSTPKKPTNQPLEAASKMVPVPESLMSPDYQDPIYDIHRPIQKSIQPMHHNNSTTTSSSNSSIQEERRQIVQPNNISRNMKSSPKLPKSATSSPKLRAKLDQRKGSLTKLDHSSDETRSLNGKVNGAKHEELNRSDASDGSNERVPGNRRRQKMSEECMAAVTIQKMWRGYRSRNLNKDTLRILHAIQAARARQHIQRLTCDMEATKAALDSERKIQQLQMQAINALWKKVSTLQANDSQKSSTQSEESTEVLRQLTVTCINLQSQVVELQTCMQEVLRAVTGKQCALAATQTDISALATPQEEQRNWLKRPQSLPLATASVPAAVPLTRSVEEFEQLEKHSEQETLEAVSELGTLDTTVTAQSDTPTEDRLSVAESTEIELNVTSDVTSADVTLSEPVAAD